MKATGSEALRHEETDPARPGDQIAGAYVVEGLLGRGASGVVYSAKHLRTGDPVALKIIHPEHCHTKQVFGRYKREAAILKVLQGPHIVKFLDFLEHDGLLAIALEYVRGMSLEEMLGARVERERAVDITLQICAGLEAAHAEGVVHRDLKPANVMIETLDGGVLRARILDFGLAKVVHGEHMVTGLTERDMIFGTPEYMAPEQARGDDVDARCDVYACGVMLYEMLTGAVPIKGSTPLATMTAQLVEAIEPPRARAPDRDIPPALEAVVLRALEKEPDKRYPSARALAEALEAASERRVISVTPRDLHQGGEEDLSDTELALRRSQIQAAAGLLAEAEKIAASRTSSPTPTPAEPTKREWRWPLVAAVAIVTCIVLGVLLALR